jgi:hypothetical protein
MNRLSERERDFALLYVAGDDDVRGNGTRSYLKAYYDDVDAEVGSSHFRSAGSNARRLLKRERVVAHMRELRAEAERASKDKLRSWMSLAPDAQRTLHLAAQGKLTFEGVTDPRERAEVLRSAVRASQEILDRALGTTKQMHEHQVTGQAVVVHVAGPGEHIELGGGDTTVPRVHEGEPARRLIEGS